METSKQLKIKPWKDHFLAWILAFMCAYLVICVVGAILSLFQSQQTPWIGIGIGFVIYTGVICLIAGIARLCYKGSLIVTNDEIIKIHASKIQFRIKRRDILFIGYRKVNIFAKLFVIIGGFIGDICTDAISIRFYKADIFRPFKLINTLEMMRSLSEEEKQDGMQEFVESITYKQAVQISQMLDVPIVKVKI